MVCIRCRGCCRQTSLRNSRAYLNDTRHYKVGSPSHVLRIKILTGVALQFQDPGSVQLWLIAVKLLRNNIWILQACLIERNQVRFVRMKYFININTGFIKGDLSEGNKFI